MILTIFWGIDLGLKIFLLQAILNCISLKFWESYMTPAIWIGVKGLPHEFDFGQGSEVDQIFRKRTSNCSIGDKLLPTSLQCITNMAAFKCLFHRRHGRIFKRLILRPSKSSCPGGCKYTSSLTVPHLSDSWMTGLLTNAYFIRQKVPGTFCAAILSRTWQKNL
jgi:hypothetical protein